MTDYLHIGFLAAVQGITEFLPISSSAHLILVPFLFAWDYQGLDMDIALHAGSLLAIIFYLRADVRHVMIGTFSLLAKLLPWRANQTLRQPLNQAERFAYHLLIATIPASFVGLLLKDIVALYLRHPSIIAVSSIFFGLLLAVADRSQPSKNNQQMNSLSALYIGISQILAFIPGTSRSGITMTTARFLGFQRTAAARFSMLLAIPIISLSALASIWEYGQQTNVTSAFSWQLFVYAVIASAIFAFVTVLLLMRWLQKFSFTPFIIYRVLLGVALLAILSLRGAF